MVWHVDLWSFWEGIRARNPRYVNRITYNKPKRKVNYAIKWKRGWWCCLWTPVWHNGRGPYISISLGFMAFYRGY